MTYLNKIGISEFLQGIQKRHFSVEELIQDHIKQIEKFKNLNAFITITDYEDLLKQAQDCDKRIQNNKALGTLDGVPISIKDTFCIKNTRTTCGSTMLKDFYPNYTATATAKLQSQGSIFVGKTNMDEFAMGSSTTTGIFGPTINPWSTDIEDPLVPGGSSGGSAVSVSAFMAMASLGTDTGGSVRQPASFNGIIGLKPSYGRISRWGFAAFASSLDHVGIFTRSVTDSALVLSAIQGFDPKDSTSKKLEDKNYLQELESPINGLKIGLIKELNNFNISDDVYNTSKNCYTTLEGLGAKIIEINIPSIDIALACYYIIACCEASSNLARYDGMRYGHRSSSPYNNFDELISSTRSEGFGDEVKTRILMGTYLLSSGFIDAYYMKAQKIRTMIFNQFKEAFKEVDIIVLPTSPTDAFKLREISDNPVQMYNNDIFTTVANLSGLPAISIPAGLSKSNLPLGMQIIAPMYQEQLMLNVAYALEQSMHINFSPPGY